MTMTMTTIMKLIRTEPVAIQSFILAVISCLIGFGVIHWTDNQIGLVGTVLALGLGLIVRQNVVPLIKVHKGNPT